VVASGDRDRLWFWIPRSQAVRQSLPTTTYCGCRDVDRNLLRSVEPSEGTDLPQIDGFEPRSGRGGRKRGGEAVNSDPHTGKNLIESCCPILERRFHPLKTPQVCQKYQG
jgi:hypothetical protein